MATNYVHTKYIHRQKLRPRQLKEEQHNWGVAGNFIVIVHK